MAKQKQSNRFLPEIHRVTIDCDNMFSIAECRNVQMKAILLLFSAHVEAGVYTVLSNVKGFN